jgi:urea transport system ATP-binding protein
MTALQPLSPRSHNDPGVDHIGSDAPPPGPPTAMGTGLAITHLNQSYGGSHTLWDVDLVVTSGSRTCLMGRNGMGKTTLLKCIMGLLPATSGRIEFKGADLIGRPAESRARLGIGYVPQGRDIFSHLTVEENLRVGLGVRKNGARAIPAHVYDLFPVLKQMRERRGGDLSGGQQQQLAIARALVLEPSLLILDEPTEGIQPNIVHQIGDILLALNRDTGITVLLVEQQLRFARRVASDFSILEKGRCVAGGPIDQLTDELVCNHLSV